MKKLYIKTWGCQMNVYDSERMADVVAPLGYAPTGDVSEADLVILNTCHIREKASEKLFSELGRMRPHQEARAGQGGRMLLAVAGCVAQAEGAEIQRRMPYVDMVFGPQSYHRLPEMIARAHREAGLILDTEFPPVPKFNSLPEQRTGTRVNAFLSVQEGCDKFCTFCVVPYTRGAEYSRPIAAIIKEAEQLIRNGAREIILLGQNVNAFHGEGPDGKAWNLARLFHRLAEMKGLKRLRYMTSHPCDMDDELIEAHRDIPQLMPFLHLPVQSGSDRILEAMNRKHTADDYRSTIERLRAARPDMALSSDFIVGFPGETDEDFKATLALAQETGYAQAYSFKYSRRPGTPAAAREDQVEEKLKDARLAQLQGLLSGQQKEFNRSMIGSRLPVLFEDPLPDGRLFGRSPYMQAVRAPGHARLAGEELPVEITQAGLNSLSGALEMADAA